MDKPIRVMVAEDFPLLREDFCDIVSGQDDMEVVGAAATGDEIVALARSTPCDVILMDIEMETVDAGIRAAEIISAIHPDIKIIFLTAHETDDMITSAMGTGAVDYVVKGCEEERLLEHIRRASQGRAELEPKIQNTVMQEYARLRRSERSLIFFINNVAHLTPAEHELVKLLLQDKKVAEIARLRCVEVVTVKTRSRSAAQVRLLRTKEIVKMIRQMTLNICFNNERSLQWTTIIFPPRSWARGPSCHPQAGGLRRGVLRDGPRWRRSGPTTPPGSTPSSSARWARWASTPSSSAW